MVALVNCILFILEEGTDRCLDVLKTVIVIMEVK